MALEYRPTRKTAAKAVLYITAFLVFKWLASTAISCIRLRLEGAVVQPDSLLHFFYFYIAGVALFTPSPLPFLITFYVLAVGFFFKWRGFVLLVLAFSTGIPLNFQAGRALKRYGFDPRKKGVGRRVARRLLGRGLEYVDSLRHVIQDRPVKMSFMLMWAPLPTQLLPFVMGLATDVELVEFCKGGLLSKFLHFSCPLILGIEANSLSAALDGEPHSWLSLVVFAIPIVLTVVVLGGMLWYIKSELKRLHLAGQEDALYDKLIV